MLITFGSKATEREREREKERKRERKREREFLFGNTCVFVEKITQS